MDIHPESKVIIPVVFEDNWLVVVNKPSGLLTIPTPKNERHTLTDILNKDLQHKAAGFHLHPCHRLDRETSGLIIYAKGKSAQKKMMEEFKKRKIKKVYIAFVQGIPKPTQAVIRRPIEGQTAITQYQVLQERNGFSVVRAQPVTGRKNQIRIHFKGIGHPILGETKYAFRRDFNIKARRLCLHANHLEFIHPITKEKICLDIELPRDLKEFLESH